MSLSIGFGKLAPEFKTKAYQAGEILEIDSKAHSGQWICLFFYPFDFTFVCPTEIRAFAATESVFKEYGCKLIGCSTDSEYAHKAWFERELPEVKYPILADT